MRSPQQLIAKAKLHLERARARWGVVDVAVHTFKEFSADDGGTHTAALTYYMFFSIFPLLLFSGAILGFLTAGNDELTSRLIEAGLEAVPLVQDVLSQEALERLQNNRGSLAITGMAFALYAGSGGVVALEHALNKIYGIREEGTVFEKRGRSIFWLVLLGLGVLLSTGLGAVAAYATQFFGNPETGGITAASVVAWILGHAFGFAVGVLMFASAYRFLPRRDMNWRQVLPGAIVAALVFEVLKEFGSSYLAAGSARRETVFGTFAVAAGLLVASYLIARVTLLAAELNDVLSRRRATRTSSAAH